MKEYGSYLKKPFLCVFSLALMLISTTAFGRTIRVPEDYSTIQNGINAAQAGDTVLVAPGTYVENIDFLGKAITVTSEGKRATTIIDGGRVRFVSGETRDSVLVGFTVQNTAGRSIDIIDSSPTIIDNIMNNGGGITIESGSPLIQGNLITNNAAGLPGGGGIYIGFGSAEIISNTISNNTASVPGVGGGIYTDIFRGGLIRDNIIIGNTAGDGAGIYIRDASFSKIVQNLIIENSATSKGGGIALDTPYTVSPLFLNNTIADNHADLGSAFYSNGLNSGASLINNIIIGAEGEIAFFCGNFGNPMPVLEFNNVFSPMADTYGDNCIDPTGSNGNISLDPLFVESTNGDYHLTANSPCIDAGTNNTADLPAIDFESGPRILDGDNDGTATVDMGVDEYVWMPKAMPWIPLLLLSPTDSGTQLTVYDAELLYEDWEIPFDMDGSFATLKKSSTELYYWHSWGNTNYKYHGPLDDPLRTQDWVKTDTQLFDFNGKADPITDRILIYNIYKRDNGDLLGFCHIEKYDFSIPGHVEFAIGLIYSTNNGDYWTYCGEIIKPEKDTDNIGGVPFLVVGDYFYVYFNEQPINTPDRRICVARANVNDVLNAAVNGEVTSWKKFNSGTWTQDGLTGVGSNILPVAGWPYDVHSDAAYNRILRKYMLTVQTHYLGQLLLYTSIDGINWEDKTIIDETDDNNFIQAYSFFASLDNTTDDCREVGSEFYIIFPRKDWPDHYNYDEFYRRLVRSD